MVVELSETSQYGRKPKTSRVRPLVEIAAAGPKRLSVTLSWDHDALSAGMASPSSRTGWSTGGSGATGIGEADGPSDSTGVASGAGSEVGAAGASVGASVGVSAGSAVADGSVA